MFPVATPDTQLFPISISKVTKKIQVTSKTINLPDRELWVCLNQFVTTVNV